MAQLGECAQKKTLEWKLLELSNLQQSMQTLIHYHEHMLQKVAAEMYACCKHLQ
uniref:Uncharacterized protein n=1 Tax=Coturnix japonica TaxID=93934 RepID=A0A8C2SP85_COTJA